MDDFNLNNYNNEPNPIDTADPVMKAEDTNNQSNSGTGDVSSNFPPRENNMSNNYYAGSYYQGNGYGNGNEPSRTPYFYSENYKNPGKKRNRTLKIVLIALASAILGGAIVGSAILFVAPAIQPAIKNYFDNIIPSKNSAYTEESAASRTDTTAPYKEIEANSEESVVTQIAEKVGPSVVGIRVTAKVQDFFLGESEGSGEGSGLIIRQDGYVMTNFHVIQAAVNGNTNKMMNGAKIEVILPSQPDKPYNAAIVGFDWRTDLAVLKIDAKNLPVVEFGNSDQLKVGELAVAIGNPGGMEYAGSVTVGVISGLNRTVNTDDGKTLTYIQTDAAINPGNSGGALLNSKGQVIGINTVKVVAQGFEGLGFAIPVNTAKQVTDSLIEHKYVTGRPALGITVETEYTEEVAKANNYPIGVMIREVSPVGAAYKAGLQRMDIILKVDKTEVKSYNELLQALSKYKPGDTVTIEYFRDGKNGSVKVQLTELKQ